MAKLNTPIDSRFRAGQISSKEWKRLSMKGTVPGKPQKTRMANFDEKTKTDGGHSRGPAHTKTGHINGPNQGIGTPALGGGKPSRGGSVNKGGQPTVSAINEVQKPNFPAGGVSSSSNSRKTLSKQHPSSSQPSHMGKHMYGGPSSRSDAPSRLR